MKESPMIFNAEMVRAILDGRKTQTRRMMKNQPVLNGNLYEVFGAAWSKGMTSVPAVLGHSLSTRCPFGEVGDRIWVRETCRAVELESGLDVVSYEAGGQDIPIKAHPLDAGLWVDLYRYRGGEGKTVPSIHMPRWASRITLEITRVRVERLASISSDDARAEGYPASRAADGGDIDPWLWFRDLWDGIYPEQTFKANPWVWVIEFKRIEGGAA